MEMNNKMTNFKVIRLISKGAFAQVYEAVDMSTGQTLALKIVIFQPLLISFFSNR